jgi:alpha-beta hydrolase superfamily lysophospholipase
MKIKALLLLLIIIQSISGYAQELSCFRDYKESESNIRVEPVQFNNGEVIVFGKLYKPEKPGVYPSVLLMHGGGNHLPSIMDVPEYFGKRAANCGVVALVYDKRGTGKSKENYYEADFNDFIGDASSGIDFLVNHEEVLSEKTGAFGVSQGGRLVANLAARNKKVSFIASVSGPIYPVPLTQLYGVLNQIKNWNIDDSLRKQIIPFWERYYHANEEKDFVKLKSLDKEIDSLSNSINRRLLPPYSYQLEQRPIQNSYGMDTITEIENVSIPWLSIYGEDDQIVPTAESVKNIEERMSVAENSQYKIIVVPDASHNLFNSETQTNYPFEENVLKWILKVTSK